MEKFLSENFQLQPKNSSDEALRRWRSAVSIVKNRKRRFRMTANLDKRSEAEEKRKKIQEKLRVALYVQKAAFHFIDAASRPEKPDEATVAGFPVDPNGLASIVRNHDIKTLNALGGINGLARIVATSLDNGISTKDAPRRQDCYGFNTYVEKPPKSFWSFVWEAFQDLTLVILMFCAFISLGVGIASEGWPKGVYDAVGIILCIFLVVIVTAISDYRQSVQFRDLDEEKKKIDVHVTRDGYRQKVSIYNLVVGDIVHLSIGDQVPADGIFILGFSLLIDDSSLSGESEPIDVNTEKPFLLSGTKVQDGSAKMLVTSVGMRTEWGRLMETISEGGEDETPLQVKLNGVATIIGKIGLLFSIITFMVLVARFLVEKVMNDEFGKWSMKDAMVVLNFFATSVTIIVVAVPEGLPLAVTLSLAFAMKQMMSEKALVRHLSACETMGSATCICTDKTGTLTTNHMKVTKVWICKEVKVVDLEKPEELRDSIPEEVLSTLVQSLFLNTSSEVVTGKDAKREILGSPTESALLEFGLHCSGDFDSTRRKFPVLKVEPFNSIRKTMSVLVSLQGGGLRFLCKGASEIVLKMCDKMVDQNGEAALISESETETVMEIIDGFAMEALRTICIAFKDLDGSSPGDNFPSGGYTLVAIMGIKDPVRPGVKDAVKTCTAAGIRVRMVTGDNINTAKAIAKECGILTDGVAIEGSDFRSKNPLELQELIPNIQVMARSLPLDKHMLVKHLKHTGETVAVTGDGTNDAPALHEADIGLAMGVAGTEVAKESADVIIMDDNFSTIVNVAKWGRAVYRNVQKFVQFQLTVNIVALMLNFLSACIIGNVPLTAVQLLWVNLIMDTLGALALATEAPNDELMKKPPVRREVDFITKTMWRNIIGQSAYQLLVLIFLIFYGKHLLKLDGPDSTSVLNTFIFNTFVFCQVFNEINSRDLDKIDVFTSLPYNFTFLGVMISTVIFQVIMVEFLGVFASTVPLSWQLWLESVLIGSLSLFIAIALKSLSMKANKHSRQSYDGYEQLAAGPDLA